jgi:isocitrate dehydrogenase kinase/phosphatase
MLTTTSSKPTTDSSLARTVAKDIILSAFNEYRGKFNEITERAQRQFEERNWQARDVFERLNLYKPTVERTVAGVHETLGERRTEMQIWQNIKTAYSTLIESRDDWELAETFFNSITRQIFPKVGMDARIEFADTDFDGEPNQAAEPIYYEFERPANNSTLVRGILEKFQFAAPYENLERDIELVTSEINRKLDAKIPDRAEILCTVFYRGKGAYIVGCLSVGQERYPLTLALMNTSAGILVNAVLLAEQEVHLLFSLTRVYFRAIIKRPYEVVRFLQRIMPKKRLSELYTALGYFKHGKTELYRELMRHLVNSDDQFIIAPGERGMVMLVFTLPSFESVFKIIKDRFAPPKDMSRRDVMERYRMVSQHDRAGRLIDAQEFEYLTIDKSRFSPDLLVEFEKNGQLSVEVTDDEVIIKQAYIEQRVTPLNLYIRETNDPELLRQAVVDCGNAIKDLANTNIFTGDMLLKNFGVGRHGRVIFYDYDELSFVTECIFKALPPARDEDDEMASEAWFGVGENDVFPEEFSRFLGLHGELRQCFTDRHGDLFTVEFWQSVKNKLQAGQTAETMPYAPERSLHSTTRNEYYYAGARG